MSHNDNVIWNRSLDCLVAVAEFATARGKSSSGAVTSISGASAPVSTHARLRRVNTLSLALAVAGMAMSPQVLAATGIAGGSNAGSSNGSGNTGTAISNCTNANNQALASGAFSIAIGCSSKAGSNTSIAIGSDAKSSSGDSMAFGTNSSAQSTFSIAIGTSSAATATGGVALGLDSVASVAGGIQGFTTNSGSVADRAAITTTNSANLGALSVGSGVVGGNRQIVNVAAGTNNNDAVNVAQLKAVDNQVVTNSTAISAIQSSVFQAKSTVSAGKNILVSASNNANGSTDYHITTAANLDVDSITIANGPSMTAQGIDAANQPITNVEAGVRPTDAANFGQLQALDDTVKALGYRIGNVEDEANAGISAAMAMSALPQASSAGRSMIGGGIATYNGESSAAFGLSRVSDNGRWTMNVNGSADTQGNFGGAIGAGFYF